MSTNFEVPKGDFRGHDRQFIWLAEPDPELTEVGPGTPCGEYLRRYWMPVAMTDQVGDLPYRIRILGEDLVMFRETGGQLGLVHLHCAHRSMSLEFGIIEEGGIRCSYHGWKYGIDGSILERPCEPAASRLKQGTCLGAYPVVEYKGLAFAYLGPNETVPPFPVFDTMVEEGDDMIPFLIESPCNWLQVMENAWDPFHTVYLHTKAVRTQFTDAFSVMPKIEYFSRPLGDFYTNTRRVDDIIWLRIHDQMLPSFTQNGGHFPLPEQSLYFGRCGLSRWITPIDDTHTQVIAWRHFRGDDDPQGLTNKDEVGFGKTDFYGQGPDRSYELRQRDPGDYDAWVSQGPKNVHKREHTAFTDRGVSLARRKLRKAIRKVKAGETLPQPTDIYSDPIPTYGGDTMLRIPLQAGKEDDELLKEVAHKVAEIYMAHDCFKGQERADKIRAALREYESSWS
ncbi:MAG: Rieske 2Fe-2S domain-containing protein [Gammaproteobacteria bacterium]|nr:Rieske 2Fe-2S domain-containing protein [Gammaproteobacteria bacterium]